MKFLCVKCDTGMKLKDLSGPDESGSLAVVYRCPECSYEMAMLTNAFETQLVKSLGVKIGPEGSNTSAEAAKCPFSGLLKESTPENSGINWSEAAVARLLKIPEFIRPMARSSIEKFATERGYKDISEQVLDEAKELMGG